MIERNRFGLNRIIAPWLPLHEFLDLAARMDLHKVELRNDLGVRDPIDNWKPEEFAQMAAGSGIRIISINALQKFNLASLIRTKTDELIKLLELAEAIECKAVILCPNNDPADKRSDHRRFAETVDALAAFGPLFQSAGVLGYIEPLGFSISSLDSLVVAQEAIRQAGPSCYRIVHDTFHHYIGPDTLSVLGTTYSISTTGLVHISGVESGIPLGDYRDEHRVLVGPEDKMKSKEQIVCLDRLGYTGDYSLEPFSPTLQKLRKSDLEVAVRKSIDFLTSD